MPKQNYQKFNKCRQKRQHAEKDTIYCGFRAFGWNFGLLLELPKGDHPKQGSWTDQVWGRPQGHTGAPKFMHFYILGLEDRCSKIVLDKASPLEKELLGVSAGTGDWIRSTKYRHRDSSDSWPPTLKAIFLGPSDGWRLAGRWNSMYTSSFVIIMLQLASSCQHWLYILILY